MAPTPGMTFEGLKCRALDIERSDHKVVWGTANCHINTKRPELLRARVLNVGRSSLVDSQSACKQAAYHPRQSKP
jgi:hypothetical protein